LFDFDRTLNRSQLPCVSASRPTLIERTPLVLSSAAAYRLRMLLAVMAATTVVVLAVVAVVLVISAVTPGPEPSNGADWGAVY
jgi:hypothetical protein